MTHLDDAALDAIKQRADNATEGPWHWLGKNGIDTPVIDVDEANWGGEGLSGYRLICTDDDGAWRYADAEFIAHARTDVPALIAAMYEARAAAAAAEQAVQRVRELAEWGDGLPYRQISTDELRRTLDGIP